MQAPHDLRRIGMQLGALPEAIQPRIRQFVSRSGKRPAVHAQIIAKQIVQTLRTRKISGILEKFRAQIFRQSDNLKEMAVARSLEPPNAPPRKNFSQTRT